jgi:4-amino-4-deoxy-L-arabinose transferase-like glycosyltransferase
VTTALLFLGLAAIFALTRSHWLDEWDSVNFALALDDFDVAKHQPHPPGYAIYVAAGKLIYLVIADHAAALTLVSSLAGAAVAAMFYVLLRRQSAWPVALGATILMALSPLYWLQSGLALTDMFGMIFVVAFLLVEDAAPQTPHGERWQRIACGIIAGLSLGARPHFTLLIVVYWAIRGWSSRPVHARQIWPALAGFVVGVAAWLIPAALATNGLDAYLSACVAQFEYRLDKPSVSVLGAPLNASYLLTRAIHLIGWLGQNFSPLHITNAKQGKFGLVVLAPYLFFAWRSDSKAVARPYIIASAVYLLMLFILLPTNHQRYFLPFCLIVGFSISGVLALFRRPVRRAAAMVVLFALIVVPSFFLVGGLTKVPPPVAALEWIKASRPTAILYADGLRRHKLFYWPGGDVRAEPKTPEECENFHKDFGLNRPILATASELCGMDGKKLVIFRRDRRIHDKHHIVSIFQFTGAR